MWKITKIDYRDNHVMTAYGQIVFEGGATYTTDKEYIAKYFENRIGYTVEKISDQ